MNNIRMPELVLLDFGGVIAEEGFKAAMVDLALEQKKDPEALKRMAFDLVYATGFTTGKIRDKDFWKALREKSGIIGSDKDLTAFVHDRFIVRPSMLYLSARLRLKGIRTAILSDQTHWLDELDERDGFFPCFDRIFNSYYSGITKKDTEFFLQVLDAMEVRPEKALFVDDHRPHVERALSLGMDAIWYQEEKAFREEVQKRFPFVLFDSP